MIEEQPAIDGDDASPTAAERGAIDRRTAMKAALGGAVAAAAWTAPRIEHLSVAPDFAQAATCLTSSGFVTRTTTECEPVIGFTSECYGNCIGTGGIDCGSERVVYTGPTTGSFPPGVTMTVVYNGYAEGNDIFDGAPGTADITVTGIRSPRQRCNVTTTQTPPCRVGNFAVSPNPIPTPPAFFTSTNPGPLRQSFSCQNQVGSQRIRLTLRLTLGCTCV